MTLISVVSDVCKDVGLKVPDQVAASTDRAMQEMLSFANQSAEEIARRVDWGGLTGSQTVTGDGTSAAKTLTGGVSRLVNGQAIVNSSGGTVRPLTRAEWTMTAVEGDPRYFLLEGTSISFWPYLANADTCTVRYQTENWCSNGTAAFDADDNTVLFPEELLTKGLMVRWRRQKGMAYQDYESEYEAALAQYAGFDDRGRL